ncbi:MAG: thioredoxin domain-containing protein [Chloroflexi bacterium]|nr:thioredoxin domain-containing protein [Chloroflexota bacterium]
MSTRNRGRNRGGKSAFGLLIGISVAAFVVVVGVIALSLVTGSRGSSSEAAAAYSQLEQFIDTEQFNGAPGFSIGDPEAPVVLVDYSDFSCPACANLAPSIEELILEEDGYVQSGLVRIVYKPVWFVNPPRSEPAARAGYCAAQQGMFWQYHEEVWNLFAASGANAYNEQILTNRADRVEGLNLQQFESCLTSPAAQQAVQSVVDEATSIGVNATPTVYVNGERLQLTQPLTASLESAIEAALQEVGR